MLRHLNVVVATNRPGRGYADTTSNEHGFGFNSFAGEENW
jgi:hypothetical protein